MNKSSIFRIASLLTMFLLVLSHITMSYPKKDDVIARFLTKMHSIFFDSKEQSSKSSSQIYHSKNSGVQSNYSPMALDTCSGRDPCHPPPPPPKPQRGP